MQFYGYGKTHIGMKRETNQDSFLLDNANQLYLVADGMGGHAGGEVASTMVVDQFVETMKKTSFVGLTNSLSQISLEKTLNKACAKIYQRSLENPNLHGMGTTASCILFKNNMAHCAHVGDSRIYLIRAGFIYQLTSDHSLVSEQLKAGLIDERTASNHQLKNVITRSIGFQHEEFVDTFSQRAESDDIFVICSDGLHNKVSDQEIVEVCLRSVEESPDRLISLANEKGGEDNISVIVTEVKDISENLI